ncbi:MAG: ABC transporter permease, partial [Myxococcales bacterium]|nr:ABC transporter permease [Myxococcales bacterium]
PELPPELPAAPWGRPAPEQPQPAASPEAEERRAEPVLDALILGRELSAELGVRIGMRVQLITPVARITPAGAIPGSLAARVGGEFFTSQYEYDSRYAYAALDRVQALTQARGRVSHVVIRLADPDALEQGVAATRAVLAELGRDDLEVQDWRAVHRNLFSAMFIEKVAMAIALLFVILVAAFGILATSLMAVLERASEIAILKAMGISDARISRVFVLEGLIVGVMGSLGGVLTGLAVCAVGSRVGLPVDEDIYYIQRLPLEVNPLEVLLVGLSAIAIVWLSSVYPARAAARMRPVDALRMTE